MENKSKSAFDALLHPLWLGSLALLVINDHVLKGAGLLPPWLTGKLSDFAGMLVAPLVLACLLRLESRAAWAGAHLAVGAVFAAINVSPACARAFESLTALTPLPWAITVDPTDLVALPALIVSFFLLGRRSSRSGWRQTALKGSLATAGTLACMGTSPPPCDGADCPAPPPPSESAALTIGNTTPQQRLVRVRHLKSSIIADCEVLLDDPTSALHREMFAPAEAWLLEPGRALPLNPRQSAGCEAVLVDAQGLPMTLIAWDTRAFPVQILPTSTAEAETVPGRMILMRQADSELVLDPHVAVFDAPAAEPFSPEPACAVPDETVGIAWSDIPLGAGALVSITSSPDGCHDLELAHDSFYVCLPLEALPFEPGEMLSVHPVSVTDFSSDTGAPASSEGIEIVGESHTIVAARGQALLTPSADPEASYDISFETQIGCEPHHDGCANLVTPLSVTFLGDDGAVTLKAGESERRSDSGATLHLVRAQEMLIRDTACANVAASQGDRYFESVVVTPIAEETP